MYRLARVLTQSPSECILYPGRLVKVRIGYNGEVDCGYIYGSCGMEVFTPKVPDFEFEIVD